MQRKILTSSAAACGRTASGFLQKFRRRFVSWLSVLYRHAPRTKRNTSPTLKIYMYRVTLPMILYTSIILHWINEISNQERSRSTTVGWDRVDSNRETRLQSWKHTSRDAYWFHDVTILTSYMATPKNSWLAVETATSQWRTRFR